MSDSKQQTGLEQVIRHFLHGLPSASKEALYAAAVPHRFDVALIAALRETNEVDVINIMHSLERVSFIQPVGSEYVLHEQVRSLLLDELWEKKRDKYHVWSLRSAKYFEVCADDSAVLEAIYHWLVADPDKGADLVWSRCIKWHNDFQYEWIESLVQLGLEHIRAGRLSGFAQGAICFWKGLTDQRNDDYAKARKSLEAALRAGLGKPSREAKCLLKLGEVHQVLAEYETAQGMYSEALQIYHTIGSRLGWANCNMRLGDVELRLAEYESAGKRYETALSIYQDIGDDVGKASCIQALGDVEFKLAEFDRARVRFKEALPIYRAIGNLSGEANCIQALGDVELELAEYETARGLYDKALAVYRDIEDHVGIANCVEALGDLESRLADYQEARKQYDEALVLYKEVFPAGHPSIEDLERKIEDLERNTT